jgi:hypothetical protein
VSISLFIGVIVAIATLIGVFITYKNHESTKKQHVYSRQERIIDRVVDCYVDRANKSISTGLNGLIKAGICEIEDDSTIRKIIGRITPRVKKNPLGSNPDQYNEINLAAFFKYIQNNNISVIKVSPQELIERFKNSRDIGIT